MVLVVMSICKNSKYHEINVYLHIFIRERKLWIKEKCNSKLSE